MIQSPNPYYPQNLPYEITNLGNTLNSYVVSTGQAHQETREKVRELCSAFNDLEKKLLTIIKAISEEADAISDVAPRTMAAVAALSIESIEKD